MPIHIQDFVSNPDVIYPDTTVTLDYTLTCKAGVPVGVRYYFNDDNNVLFDVDGHLAKEIYKERNMVNHMDFISDEVTITKVPVGDDYSQVYLYVEAVNLDTEYSNQNFCIIEFK